MGKFNKEFRFLLCVIDIIRKYTWVVPLKDKKGITIVKTNKPNEIWIDKSSEFYNNYSKKLLQDNNIEMYSTYNEGKSFVAERFIRPLKKNYKYMTSISKNVYGDKLDSMVN